MSSRWSHWMPALFGACAIALLAPRARMAAQTAPQTTAGATGQASRPQSARPKTRRSSPDRAAVKPPAGASSPTSGQRSSPLFLIEPTIANTPPAVSAGPDATVTQAASVTLNGTATDDGVPGLGLTFTWNEVSGPGKTTFGNTSSISTWARFSLPGTYILSLTASDGSLSSIDTTTITVNSTASSNTALRFPGTDAGVSFGAAPTLGLSTFTLETWFRRRGSGQTTSTGTGGVTAVPLISKGRSEEDGTTKDMNYFLGISASGKLVADFEEGAAGSTPGLNHPVTGATTVVNNTWYHAAATYDGTTWRLYLNGMLDGQATIGQPPRADSIQHAAIATAMNASGAPAGYFNGDLDEVRIWNSARSEQQITATMNRQLVSQSGLAGRWGLNEGLGTRAADSSGAGPHGVVVGTNWSWIGGASFSSNTPPEAPVLTGPPNNPDGLGIPPRGSGISGSVQLGILAADNDQNDLTIDFFGRAIPASAPDFTLVTIPDTQHYVEGQYYPTFTAQTQWIANNRNALNVAFVTHLGDIVENRDTFEYEWTRADTSLSVLEASGIQYNASPGNHDVSATGVALLYDKYLPVSRFQPQASYGGWLGQEAGDVNRENKNNFELFSVGSLDFLIIHLEADIPDYSLAWADKILKRYPTRRAIISTHIYLNITGTRPVLAQYRSNGTPAEQVWQQLIRPNCNVFLVVNGHYHGEGRRTDLNSCGQPVHQIVQDYQDFANGGDGWLRYYAFKPADNRIVGYTFSPTRNGGLGEHDTDAVSQFTLDYTMQGTPFTRLGSVTRSGSGAATVLWAGLAPGTRYEWYVAISDGHTTTVGPVWVFQTE